MNKVKVVDMAERQVHHKVAITVEDIEIIRKTNLQGGGGARL